MGSGESAAAGLRKWSAAGWRPVVFLRWPSESWRSGVRGTGHRFPLDLRDAFSRGHDLGESLGDSDALLEIDNEPDIGFCDELPETYAAFFKAMALGIQAGKKQAATSAARPVFGKQWFLASANRSLHAAEIDRHALMAPMALPPGPYFSRLVCNGLLSYTAGVNFHYYGYAEDFSGVYQQFEDAVRRPLPAAALPAPDGAKTRVASIGNEPRSFPVFITEYGYGTLSGPAATTVAGRVRQWRWFQSVANQARALRIEAPMAFYLPPYLEHARLEFGLTMKPVSDHLSALRSSPSSAPRWSAGGLGFQPADFGLPRAEPWMDAIGRNVGGSDASPALAWLMAQRTLGTSSRAWTVPVAPASAVVIDFVGGRGLAAVKSLQGYALSSTSGGGAGAIRVYNFSEHRISGRLEIGAFAQCPRDADREMTLEPGEMRILPVTLSIPGQVFSPHEWAVRFDSSRRGPPSCFSTLLYPDSSKMRRHVLALLVEAPAGRENAGIMDGRPLAAEEPPLSPSGRWRVTQGVTVAEREGVWSFTITGFPSQPLQTGVAELVLPDGFDFPENGLFEMEYRLVPRAEHAITPVSELRMPSAAAATNKESLGIYWRTANGNRYAVGGTPPATNTWQRYSQAKSSFTMWFYGRANLPWLLAENRPVALVFQFGPNHLPATFEVRSAAITRYAQ